MPGIMDFFRGKPSGMVEPAAATVSPTAVNANPTIPNANTPVPNGAQNGIPAVPADQSPLAQFSKLWDAPKDGASTGIPNPVPDFTLDPAKLREVASGIDFTVGIGSEKIKAAFSGDETAMREILNGVGRQNFQQTYGAGAQTIQEAMKRQTAALTEKTIPEILRRDAISTGLKTSNDLFSDPATAPLMQTLEKQFADAYPTASPEAIRDYTAKYMNGIAAKVAGGQGKVLSDAPKAEKASTDWEKWATN